MNNYIEYIRTFALKNKHTDWYCELIESRRLRLQDKEVLNSTIGYVENHHIIPESFYIEFKKEDENLVFLTAREHFIAHKLLTKMFSGIFHKKMSYAFKWFRSARNNPNVYFNSKLYNVAKLNFKLSEESKLKIKRNRPILSGKNNPRWGMHHSEKTKRKMSIAHSGKNNPLWGTHLSEEHKRKISKNNGHSMLGKHHSEEAKRKMSETKIKNGVGIGDKNHMYGKHHSDETKRKLSISKTGGKHSLEAKRKISENNPNKRPVKQINKKTNEIIKIWPNIITASKILNICANSISSSSSAYKCKNGYITKSAGGFKWEYV
jgi:hypothetical protein